MNRLLMLCFFLSAVNQDFFRAAATRNPVVNVAGKKDSCNFSLFYCCCCCYCCCLGTAVLREVLGIRPRLSPRDNSES